MKILQIIKIMERFLLLSFLVLVLGFNSGCSNDGTNSTPSGAGGAGGAGGTSEPAAPTTVSGKVDDDGFHVWLNAPAGGDGSSWENAFGDLQKAIEAANTHATKKRVYIAQGTYKPTSRPNGGSGDREKHFSLRNNVEVIGGYSGNGNVNDPDVYKTILSGDINGDDDLVRTTYENKIIGGKTFRVAKKHTDTGSNNNVYHVFYHPEAAALTDKAKLSNVTITKGNANEYGGGMYNSASSPTLIRVNFKHNNARYSGGGMYNKGSHPNLTKGTFIGNRCDAVGGGMYNEGSSPALTDVTFKDNITASRGGAVYSDKDSDPKFEGTTQDSFTPIDSTNNPDGKYNGNFKGN